MQGMRVIRLESLEQFAAVNLLLDPGSIPGPVVVPQCAQISLVWFLPDQKFAHNVLYGRYAGTFAGSVASANSIMTSLTTGAPWTGLASQLSPGTTLAAVTIRDVNPTDGSGALISSTNAAVPGTGTGTALPCEVAAVITKRTAKAGRGNRGRIYLGGFTSATLTTGDVIAPGTVTAIQAWANIIGSALAASGYTHVMGQPARAAYTSPVTGRVFQARPATSTDITSLQVRDNHWDSQRRRGLR